MRGSSCAARYSDGFIRSSGASNLPVHSQCSSSRYAMKGAHEQLPSSRPTRSVGKRSRIPPEVKQVATNMMPERLVERVPQHELVEMLAEGEVRLQRADASPVKAHRHVEALRFGPRGVVLLVVPRQIVHQAGGEERGDEPPLDVAGQLVHGRRHVVRGEHGGAEDAAGTVALGHEIGHPVVVPREMAVASSGSRPFGPMCSALCMARTKRPRLGNSTVESRCSISMAITCEAASQRCSSAWTNAESWSAFHARPSACGRMRPRRSITSFFTLTRMSRSISSRPTGIGVPPPRIHVALPQIRRLHHMHVAIGGQPSIYCHDEPPSSRRCVRVPVRPLTSVAFALRSPLHAPHGPPTSPAPTGPGPVKIPSRPPAGSPPWSLRS